MKDRKKIIPFYGVTNKRVFEIERRSMDRDHIVVRHLDDILPSGRVLDIGAGDGYTAALLTRRDLLVVPIEPAEAMIDLSRSLPWVQAIAQELPFKTDSFTAAYATWAYFFTSDGFEGQEGLEEARRVVIPDGLIIMVDNAGDDEFSDIATSSHVSNPLLWKERGFECKTLTTSFRFDSLDEARELLTFYFGENAGMKAKLEIEFKVAVYIGCAKEYSSGRN